MFSIFCVVIVAEESVIETEFQNNSHKRKRDCQKRQHAVFARTQLAHIHGHEHKPERGVDHAADSKDERVLDGLFYLSVYRGYYSIFNSFRNRKKIII